MDSGTELGAQEWRNSLFLSYGIDPPDLPSHCDGCGSALSIFHALEFSKGGLIVVHHNELRDGLANLSGKAFTPAHMRDDPKFFTGHAVRGGRAKPRSKVREHRRQTRGGRREIY